ncbi:hypothetical protein SK128_017598 [Halocaridina rubra]|uniref:Uncharacterized protein n=1 Tax=Halocaridina rubra TaxID=373956 RepID=A0AAN9A668_HALRR
MNANVTSHWGSKLVSLGAYPNPGTRDRVLCQEGHPAVNIAGKTALSPRDKLPLEKKFSAIRYRS